MLLKSDNADTNKVNALLALAKDLLRKDPDKSLDYFRQSLELSRTLNFQVGISRSYNSIGICYFSKGNYDSALVYYGSGLTINIQIADTARIAAVYNNIARVYEMQGLYEKSLDYYLRSLKMSEATNNQLGIAGTCLNMGNLYLNLSNDKKAMEYYTKCRDISTQLNDSIRLAYALGNISIIYRRQKKPEEALEYQQQAISIREKIKDSFGLLNGYANLGKIYSEMKKYDLALEYYHKALEGNEKSGRKFELALVYHDIGNVYYEKKNYSSAIDYYNKTLSLSRQIGAKEIERDAYRYLALAHERLQNYEQAYIAFGKYSLVKDTLLNQDNQKNLTEIQTKYETEKKEQQITLLNKEGELQKSEVRRQKIIIWSVAGGLLVVLILSIFIFRERRKSEKLLLNILPAETARELKANGKATAMHYESVTVMFTDFKNFTQIAEKLSAEELVSELDFLFKKFDEIISKYPIEKIKTIGDAYMCAGGLPTANKTNAMDVVSAALEIQNFMTSPRPDGHPSPVGEGKGVRWQLRIGIHTGPVTAGVVGAQKFAYDIWGDTVNTASRMESAGEPGKINISGATYEHIKQLTTDNGLLAIHRGKIPAKNKGEIEMYFVEKKNSLFVIS